MRTTISIIFFLAFSSALINSQAQDQAQDTIKKFTYDNNGNIKTIARPLNRSTSYSYDELDRRNQENIALGLNDLLTTLSYDGLDQVISVTDPRNLITSYAVDGFGNLSGLSSPDTRSSSYTTDEAGNVVTFTDARGKITQFKYDALNRLVQAQYQSGILSQYEYDGGPSGPVGEIGNLTKITDESGSTVFTHDLKGRALTRTQFVTAGGANVQLSMQYSYGSAGPEIGKLTSITYPSGTRVNYFYGGHGRVSSVTLNQSATSAEVSLLMEITYTPTGEVQSWKWGSGMLPMYQRTYDLDGRLTSYPIDLQGTIRTVGYNAAGMITSYSHSGGANPTQFNQAFTYDTADRLTSFTLGGVTTGYSYDANGNRTQQTGQTVTYSYNTTSNRLNSASFPTSQVYGYDAAGNRTSDSRNTYTYGDRGRLVHVRGGATLDMYYNALHQRVLKVGALGLTYYVYDEGGRTVGEYSNGGGSTVETVFLGDLPIAAIMPQGYFYVSADHLSAPLVLTQSDGTIIWDWRHRDPFGNNIPLITFQGFAYNYRFPGQIADVETGHFYNYFRDYDPQTGQYLQSDPIGLRGGINTYGYVGGNPVSYTDPRGLQIGVPVVPPPPIIPPRSDPYDLRLPSPGPRISDLFKPSPYLPSWDWPDWVYGAVGKPPKDAHDPNGAKAPGKPGNAEGFCEPKPGKPQWGKNPNGNGSGWVDADGNVWVPTGPDSGSTGDAHGGPHWDVQRPGREYENIYPGGKRR